MTAVAVSDPASTYWRSIVYIESTFSNGATFTGSGVMVGPNDVLTAGHVLYMSQQGGAATSVRIIPAYDPSPYSAPYGELTSTSFHYFAGYDDGSGLIMPGNGGPGLVGAELDIGIIDLSTALGDQTGWMRLDPAFTSGIVNVTGFPAVYGRNMMNDSGFAYADSIDSVVVYSGLELHPGNSGGPVWYADDAGAHVVGVASTVSWGAALKGTYDTLAQWIAGNDHLIVGGVGAPDQGGDASNGSGSTPGETPAPYVPPPPPDVPLTTGGSGNDQLAGGIVLDGGSGNDVFHCGNGSHTIIGGTGTDTVLYGPRGEYGWAYDHGRVTVTHYGAGTVDTLTGVERLQFADTLVLTHNASHLLDMNGDGRADIFTRSLDTGATEVRAVNGTQALSTEGTALRGGLDWNVVALGDFNGDGKGDVLWQQDQGQLAIWNMDGAGVGNSNAIGYTPEGATVAGTGDFDGDGRSDILWRGADGTVSVWQMNDHDVVRTGSVGQVSADWRIAGIADFNGDHRADVLWQNDNGAVAMWLMDGTTHTGGGVISSPSIDWRLTGVGDFDGDGRADILWRHDGGATSIWLMNGENIVGGWGTVTGNPSLDWTIAGIGDFNGDHKDDVLWQNLDGTLKVELLDGLHTAATGVIGTLATDWVVS